jgi:Skp family chaperone for outer membrane proteins
MTHFTKALLAGLTLLIFIAPVIARAEAAPVSVAIVDVQQLLTESKAGKNIQDQLEKRKAAFLTEINKQEQTLREDQKKLTDQRTSLSAEEFSKKAEEFETKLNSTRSTAQEQKKALEDSAVKALGTLRDEIIKITKAVSTEKGYNLVVTRQSVVLSDSGFDITAEVMEKLNTDISQIALDKASN